MRAGGRAGDPPRGAPRGVRQAARRPAADAERARRPRARVGGGDVARDAARARLRRGARRRRAGAAFARLATAVVKYWVCKRAPVHAAEALECLGGNGYVEESVMPRLYREAPLNSIWEGSGNVIVPRRAARDGRRPRVGRGVPRRGRRRRAGADRAARRARRRLCATSWPTSTASRPARGASSSGWRWRCRPRCSCATAPGGRRRVLRLAAGRRPRAARSARCRAASRPARSSSGTGCTSADAGAGRRRSQPGWALRRRPGRPCRQRRSPSWTRRHPTLQPDAEQAQESPMLQVAELMNRDPVAESTKTTI